MRRLRLRRWFSKSGGAGDSSDPLWAGARRSGRLTVRDFSKRPDISTLWAGKTEPEPLVVDPATLPPCVDAEEFAGWIEENLKDVSSYLTHNGLDNALLHLTKEYLFRLGRVRHAHRDLHCIDTVFSVFAEALFAKQMEMIRLNRFSLEAPIPTKEIEEKTQELYIGETQDGD